ncbi:MAG: RagB/SusD family nutrient uptake outer membrane protein [Bacteroidaceae bacterium]|nr:RagB/SusD family nutrient uptake outer membrane protein [Bacteroidaceae bacterium]MDO4801950.1 RagB/SusD family nutrient uptake outer membrane protein [Prevotellaceae bacterium]
MKNIKKNIGLVGLVGLMGLTVASCDLDLLPLNDVVLENFWTNKQDVQSVVSSCYLGLQESGCVEKMILWGEGRSDNIVEGQDVDEEIKNMLKGNMKTTNTICDWAPFYEVINRCNVVTMYAPSVAEKDPNYTNSDLAINLAEVKTIRALCYFELVKAFGKVPFTFQASIDDDQNYLLPQTAGELIIDTLIMDLESCKNSAQSRYAHDMRKSSGKVTRSAIYALLADLYLWRASDANLDVSRQKEYYQKSIECSDYVMRAKMDEYKLDEDGELVKSMDMDVYADYHFPLLAEEKGGKNSNGPLATNAIFGKGNSFESIFELTYEDTQDDAKQKNEDVSRLYGNSTSQGGGRSQQLSANDQLILEAFKKTDVYDDTKVFSCPTDYRSIASFKYDESEIFKILKYVVASNKAGSEDKYGKVVSRTSSSWVAPQHSTDQDVRSSGQRTEGWIFYRITDIMLMRAEAETCLAALINPATTETGTIALDAENKQIAVSEAELRSIINSDSLLYQDAFNLVSAVYMRSNPGAWDNSKCRPQANNYTSYSSILALVELERQRELLFEGKRYYDLVRHSRRDGNTNWFKTKVGSKFSQASRAALAKMNLMDFMYLPVLKEQMKINPYLDQNPIYYDEEDVVKN